MKTIGIICCALLMTACTITENGVVIDKPTVPQVNVCENVATDADVQTMKSKIEAQSFKDERMQTAKFVTKGYCFTAQQVIDIMDAMTFEDAKLEMAKDLYDQCTNRNDYDIVVNSLTHKSDRDELRAFIANQ